MNGAYLPSQADAPPHVGLLERVEFQGRVLDQLIRYQNEMRQWFTRRLEELSNDVRGPQPIQEFPPFDHWVEMQMKSNARISTGTEEASLRQAVAGPDYLGRRG